MDRHTTPPFVVQVFYRTGAFHRSVLPAYLPTLPLYLCLLEALSYPLQRTGQHLDAAHRVASHRIASHRTFTSIAATQGRSYVANLVHMNKNSQTR